MKYRIHAVSKMVGVAPQTIRFYEKYGILPTERGPKEGERMYEVRDINILMRSRMYRNAGFTLAETSALQNKVDADGMRQMYQKRADELEKELRWQGRVLARLREDIRLLEQLPEKLHQFQLSVSPAGYGMLYSLDGQHSVIERKQYEKIRPWVDLMPVVQPMPYFRRETLPFCPGRSLGFFLPETEKDLLTELPQEEVFYLPAQPAWYLLLDGYAREHDLLFYIQPFLKELKNQGKSLSGDVYGRVVTSLDSTQSYHHYTELWFPVEN